MPPTPRALAALLLLAPACAEDSSFVMRWQVGRTAEDAEVPLTSVRQCADLGLSHVKVTTLADDGSTEDVREFSCFPDAFADPNGAVGGPELGPGTYHVSILGLSRRDLPRPGPDDPDPDPDDDVEILSRKQTVVVRTKGEGLLVDGFRLIGIDECHDGIDNDRDGAVDQTDVPCRQGQVAEDLDISGALFTFEASLLGGNPRATCDGLDIDRIRITLDDDPANTREIPCTTLAQSFSADLAPGEHTWTVEGLADDGAPITAPLTGDAPFIVPEESFTLVEISVDFSLDRFLADPAFSKPQRFSIEFEPYEGAAVNRICAPDLGALAISRVRLTLRAATADAPDDFEVIEDMVTVPTLIHDDPVFPVTALCNRLTSVHSTSPLVWSATGYTGYKLQVEAWREPFANDGLGPCFSSEMDPDILAPGVDVTLKIPRVRSDGVCSDCPDGVADCDNCIDGVCMP